MPRNKTPGDAIRRVNRFEVIDYTGDDHLKRRAFVKYSVSIELSYEDGGRTLKVFVTPRVKRKEVGT